MESESTEKVETRSQRRSRTPGLQLRVSAERETNGQVDPTDRPSKTPSVTTITEEISSSQKSKSSPEKPRNVVQTRTVTSDYSSDENAATKQSFTKTTTEKTVTITTRSGTSGETKTTTEQSKSVSEKQSKLSPTKKEIRQNEINRALENSHAAAVIRTSTPKMSSKKQQQQKKTSLTPEELKQHAAYKEYMEAGEYWNKFPKTDYTYSELSSHRRELAPGIVAMPNMSRPGLYKHAERINIMIQRDPTQEAYIRQRYASPSYASFGSFGGNYSQADPYDSGEEQVDLTELSNISTSRSKRFSYYDKSSSSAAAAVRVEEHRSIISRFFLGIVNFFYSSVHTVSRVFNRSEHNMYYTRIEDERGILRKTYSFFNTLLTSIFKKVYLLISSVLFLDTWLLQSSSSDVQQGRRKRKFLLLLLILLPFLLFGGIYLYLDPTPLQSFREHLSNPLLNYDFKLNLPDTEAAKAFAFEKWDSARQFTEYYLDNIKVFSLQAAGEIQKIWQENVNAWF